MKQNKDYLLRIKNLKKNYHDIYGEICAIDDISLDIYPKEWISIVGPSGCGKTSLLSILSNLEKLSSGEIIYSKDNLKIGYMLQKDSLFPWKTILDNCLIGLEINHCLNDENKKRVIELTRSSQFHHILGKQRTQKNRILCLVR